MRNDRKLFSYERCLGVYIVEGTFIRQLKHCCRKRDEMGQAVAWFIIIIKNKWIKNAQNWYHWKTLRVDEAILPKCDFFLHVIFVVICYYIPYVVRSSISRAMCRGVREVFQPSVSSSFAHSSFFFSLLSATVSWAGMAKNLYSISICIVIIIIVVRWWKMRKWRSKWGVVFSTPHCHNVFILCVDSVFSSRVMNFLNVLLRSGHITGHSIYCFSFVIGGGSW